MMKKHNLFTLLGLVLILVTACRDENLAPIATFDAAEKGAYVRVVTQNNGNVNLFDIENSTMEYTVEFVDLKQGNLVSEYTLQLLYEDNNPQNGDNSVGPIAFRSWSASDFSTNKAGFKGIENITITASELITKAGLDEDNILSGDNFRLQGSVTTTSGQSFNQANSSAAVNGLNFRGFFNFNLRAFCPSNLEGTYTYQSRASSIKCSSDQEVTSDLSGTVSVLALGDGKYNISDWSFGAYKACYGEGRVADSDKLQFTETCKTLAFTGKIDEFGDKWSFQSEVQEGNWTIEWENTFGEKGKTVLINENGWDFVIE